MTSVKIPESTIQVKLVELTDNCIDKIADAVVRKLADRKTEPSNSEKPNNCTEPQTDGVLFKGNLKEGYYRLIKTTNGWVLEGADIAYCGFSKGEPQTDDDKKHCVFCKWVYEPNVCGRCRNMNLFADAIEDEPRTITDGTYLYAYDKMLGEWRPIQDISGHKQTERSSE